MKAMAGHEGTDAARGGNAAFRPAGKAAFPGGPGKAGQSAGHAPHPIDAHVGARVRLRRHLLNMSQKALAEALGMSFQQVQNFERGLNRIAAGRLHEISRILDVPVSYFFDALPNGAEGDAAAAPSLRPASVPGMVDDDLMHQRETLDLIRTYYAVPDPALRKRVFDLIRSLESDH